MKIILVINDMMAMHYAHQATGVLNNPSRRSVTIELTDEQVKKIGLRSVGSSKGEPVLETIESISLLSKEEV